jgi:hypothetical protein
MGGCYVMFKKLCFLRATLVQGTVYFLVFKVAISKARSSIVWQRIKTKRRRGEFASYLFTPYFERLLSQITVTCAIFESVTCTWCRIQICRCFYTRGLMPWRCMLLYISIPCVLLCVHHNFLHSLGQCVRRFALSEEYYFIMAHNSVNLLLLLI